MIINKDEMKAFDAQKAYEVLDRVHKFLGILIRENLVKDAPFLDEGELENESDLADDVWEVLQTKPRNCDVGAAEEQDRRFDAFCKSYKEHHGNCFGCAALRTSGDCKVSWMRMPCEEKGSEG